MPKINDKKITNHEYQPPKLPIWRIATTFIAPTLVVILPYLFKANENDMKTMVIIALSLLSVMLLVLCFSFVLEMYSEAFKRQLMDRDVKQLMEQINDLKIQATKSSGDQEQYQPLRQ